MEEAERAKERAKQEAIKAAKKDALCALFELYNDADPELDMASQPVLPVAKQHVNSGARARSTFRISKRKMAKHE